MTQGPVMALSSLNEIAASFELFLFDMFGTLWNGEALFPHTLDVLTQLKKNGKKVFIVSNSTVSEALSEKRACQNGLIKNLHFDAYITAGETLFREMRQGLFEQLTGQQEWRFYTLPWTVSNAPENIRHRYVDDIKQAHILFLTWLCHPNSEPPETLDPFYEILEQGLERKLPFVCANPDYMAFRGSFKYITLGAAAQWYSDQGGYVYWVGKPYPQIYQRALQTAQVEPHKALMVGDTIRTDILGAFRAGIKSVLVTTGVTGYYMAQGDSLSARMEKEGAIPDYLLKEIC